MVANTGTYLDRPFHGSADGKGLSPLPLRAMLSARISPASAMAIYRAQLPND
jgi:kynurenine formamidase